VKEVITTYQLQQVTPFQPQQPRFCLQTATAAVTVQTAVGADNTVAGDNQGHGVGSVGLADGS
jgi:hypothetical protein